METFYGQHVKEENLKHLHSLINTDCADGNSHSWVIRNIYIDIIPAIDYYAKKTKITVILSDLTTARVNIPSKAIICELQPVSVDDKPSNCTEQEEQQNISNEIHIGTVITQGQEIQPLHLLKGYDAIFSKRENNIG